jgi:hypothetical protein
MVIEKKGIIIKMEIKIEINFKVIRNLNKKMMMIGIKLRKKTGNVNLEPKKIQTAMKNKLNSKITEAEAEEASTEVDKEEEEIEEQEVEIKKVIQSNDLIKIDVMQ